MVKIERSENKIKCLISGDWLLETPEEKIRQEYTKHLIEHYNYDISQMARELKVNNSQRGTGRAFADIVVWKSKEEKENNNSAYIVVECKSDDVRIKDEDYFQGANYASWANAKFFITHNNKETKFFRVNPLKLPNELDEISDIPKKNSSEGEIEEILKQTKVFSRREFTNLLHECHNVIRNRDKLDPAAAFDEISKVLFMKIRYEREDKYSRKFTKEYIDEEERIFESRTRPVLMENNVSNAKTISYLQHEFDRTKKHFAEDKLFEENDKINIRESTFKEIVKKLQKYNLKDTQDDVKGIAFERFLGQTFRGEIGQFFTPRPVVDFMVDFIEPRENELICDPSSGSGGFLIKYFDTVRDRIENDIHNQKKKVKKEIESQNISDEEKVNQIEKKFDYLNKELEKRIDYLSRQCIFGTDANSRMARTSKMNMIMHGDGHGGVHHNDGLFNVNGIWEDKFDIILMNPPFGSNVDNSQKLLRNELDLSENTLNKYKEKYGDVYEEVIKSLENKIGDKILDFYELGSKSKKRNNQKTEVLFVERGINLLKKGGRMGIVLPEGILNGPSLEYVREFCEGKAKILGIVSISQDAFVASKATVKTSLIFFEKFSEEDEKNYNKISKESREFVEEHKFIDERNELRDLQDKIIELKNSKNKNELKLIQKEFKDKEKLYDEKVEEEIRREIKKRFNYKIFMAHADNVGISTTGSNDYPDELNGKYGAEFAIIDEWKIFKENKENYLGLE